MDILKFKNTVIMTGKQYADRLLEDIQRVIEMRSKSSDPMSMISAIKTEGVKAIENFGYALKADEAEAHLDILSQFLNVNKRLISHDKGIKVDIQLWEKEISKNFDEIAGKLDAQISNKDLIDPLTKKHLKDYLIEQLDFIHEAAH